MEEKLILTKEGYAKLQAEYRNLIDVERPEVIAQLQAARAQGDLSENSEYDAARDRQAKIESRIAEIEHIFDISEILTETSASNRIFLGNVVTFRNLSDDQTVTVKIVGSTEADPMAEPYPMVSNESALGAALIDHNVGDHVNVNCALPYEIEIVSFGRE